MERVIANSTGFETKVLQNKRKDLFLHRGLIVSIVILVCVTIDFIRFEFIDSKFG